MPDSTLRRAPRTAVATRSQASMVASARLISDYATTQRSPFNETATDIELWAFYNALGEFGAFVDWMSRAMSRVRLMAAEQMPGGDEPAPLEDGPAAQIMEAFYGGTAGQARFMEAITPQMLVPGQGWLVPERFDESLPLEMADWSVQSNSTFRERNGVCEVQVMPGVWRQIAVDSLPCRIWMPDPQFPFMARSPSLAALPVMRRIDLTDKRILAELLSRLVMNGMLWIPQEGQLPASPAYLDQPDPFFAELIDIAGRNIATPGSALAAVPMPVKFPGELIDKIKHMSFAQPFDEQLLAERDKELARLAKTLPLSQERQEGMADANHWTGFQIADDDIKISITPIAEMIAHGVAVGYLYPLLAALGEPLTGPNGGRLLVWPDYSELAARPDKSKATLDAYDRLEVNGAALRRESGLDESDMPSDTERADMALLRALREAATWAQGMELLTGQPVPPAPAAGVPPVGPASGVGDTPAEASPAAGLPDESGRIPGPVAGSGVLLEFNELRQRVVNGRR